MRSGWSIERLIQSGYHYRLFGLGLSVNRQLPGLATSPSAGPIDIEVNLAAGDGMDSMPVPVAAWVPVPPGEWVSESITESGRFIRLRFAAMGSESEFIFGPAGKRLWVSWNALASIEDVSAMLLGPILGCLLRFQGRTFLHSSVVSWAGSGLAFLGPKGAGKSTMALALIQRGAELVTDDIGLLLETEAGFAVPFGPPAVRMRPGPADALCGSFDLLRPLWTELPHRPLRRSLDVPQLPERQDTPVPLRNIYVLADREPNTRRSTIVPMPPAAALSMLMAQRSGTVLLDRAAHARDFSLLSRLAATVPVKQIFRREGLDGLDEFVDVVLADAAVNRRPRSEP
jgi:hypothetical protein